MSDGEPVFDAPPVVEVSISVLFAPLLGLRAVHLGLLAQRWQESYPRTEEYEPLPPLQESTAGHGAAPSFTLSIEQSPLPRTWFIDPTEEYVVQVQRDRLVLNWRRRGEDYPHYAQLRPRFVQVFTDFAAFLDDHQVGEITPTQCHVTYVNAIPTDSIDSDTDAVGGLLAGWSGEHSSTVSLGPDAVAIWMRYPIEESPGDRVGYLSVNVSPALSNDKAEPVLIMEMTARGRPVSSDLAGVTKFTDAGHHAIVTMFASLTTPAMHTVWRRRS